jgi:hypothetical protein
VAMVAGLVAVVAVACGPPAPYIRYVGTNFGRQPRPVESMETFRTTTPDGRFQDLGTVTVTCPSASESVPFGGVQQVGGCTYDWAVFQACKRASATGADGIHSIETTVNNSGKVVSLRASAFVRLPPLVSVPTSRETQNPSIEERLQHLDKLKQDGLINPDEYARTREEILRGI